MFSGSYFRFTPLSKTKSPSRKPSPAFRGRLSQRESDVSTCFNETDVKTLKTHLLPDLIDCDFADSCAVVIDVLRASTTIVHGHGNVRRICPCLTIEDAQKLKRNDEQLLLGGERNCTKIPGFDLDNSPTSYTAPSIAGRDVAFTTTNGTRAMLKSESANRIFVGAFANLAAIVRQASEFDTIHLVCAGTNGSITSEDCLFAGNVVSELIAIHDCELNDSSQLVHSHFRSLSDAGEAIYDSLCQSQGGQNLLNAGMSSDIRICSARNTHDVVPEFDSATRCIH
jgi:2-phosphosulfolactate phosphatase